MKIKSVLAILLVGLLAFGGGLGTMAYFSDTATSSNNEFTAGTLDLGDFNNGELTTDFEVSNLYPGFTSEEKVITVENDGSLDLVYNLKEINPKTEDDRNLLYNNQNGLKVSINGSNFMNVNNVENYNIGRINADDEGTFSLAYRLPGRADNNFQNLNTNLEFVFEAKQVGIEEVTTVQQFEEALANTAVNEIVLNDGIYTVENQESANYEFEIDRPVTIKAKNDKEAKFVINQRRFMEITGNDVVIDGIHFESDNNGADPIWSELDVSEDANGVKIRNCKFGEIREGINGSPILSVASGADDVTIYNNVFVERSFYVDVAQNANIIIKQNEVSDVYSEGFWINMKNNSEAELTIENNSITGIGLGSEDPDESHFKFINLPTNTEHITINNEFISENTIDNLSLANHGATVTFE